ncbi:MAG: TraV family lipoprotein [Candidatus Omnitrophica bacterium]|nr:TraV family lipoprotein [Candidatus Omnitrophota bacterium]MDE2214336.1 TraV family lipoprotein [Candidatus Omnitrophota bacterium]MDE2231085.1 TraV family lipoprotein [Candidatus Omnitrophota bacterium]
MPFKFLTLVISVLLLGGCTWLYEPDPDFDKPLISIPGQSDVCTEPRETKPTPKEVWIEAKTSRIWVSPHVDQNGDYIDGYYKYIIIKPGHWAINGNQTPISK